MRGSNTITSIYLFFIYYLSFFFPFSLLPFLFPSFLFLPSYHLILFHFPSRSLSIQFSYLPVLSLPSISLFRLILSLLPFYFYLFLLFPSSSVFYPSQFLYFTSHFFLSSLLIVLFFILPVLFYLVSFPLLPIPFCLLPVPLFSSHSHKSNIGVQSVMPRTPVPPFLPFSTFSFPVPYLTPE